MSDGKLDGVAWEGAGPRALVPALIEPEIGEKRLRVLVWAYRQGYFQQPRAITGREIAEHFGYADPETAATQLRHGVDRVIAAYAEVYADVSTEPWGDRGGDRG